LGKDGPERSGASVFKKTVLNVVGRLFVKKLVRNVSEQVFSKSWSATLRGRCFQKDGPQRCGAGVFK
jgi:hypothetical protein